MALCIRVYGRTILMKCMRCMTELKDGSYFYGESPEEDGGTTHNKVRCLTIRLDREIAAAEAWKEKSERSEALLRDIAKGLSVIADSIASLARDAQYGADQIALSSEPSEEMLDVMTGTPVGTKTEK
jgi:hypothetical protein